MPGGKIQTVEQIGNVMLCCYGSPEYPGWAVFKRSGEDWESICNGKFEDVIKKYIDARNKR